MERTQKQVSCLEIITCNMGTTRRADSEIVVEQCRSVVSSAKVGTAQNWSCPIMERLSFFCVQIRSQSSKYKSFIFKRNSRFVFMLVCLQQSGIIVAQSNCRSLAIALMSTPKRICLPISLLHCCTKVLVWLYLSNLHLIVFFYTLQRVSVCCNVKNI